MGYDVWPSGQWDIDGTKAEEAVQALLLAIAKKDGYSSISEWIETEKPTPNPRECPIDYIDNRLERGQCYAGGDDLKADGFVMSYGDDGIRHEEDDRWLFDVVAPFVDEGDTIYFKGEDDYEWAWEARGGQCVEVESSRVWGNEAQAPATINKLIEVIYPGGVPIATCTDHRKVMAAMTEVETILREAGFGPQAGMDELQRLAAIPSE